MRQNWDYLPRVLEFAGKLNARLRLKPVNIEDLGLSSETGIPDLADNVEHLGQARIVLGKCCGLAPIITCSSWAPCAFKRGGACRQSSNVFRKECTLLREIGIDLDLPDGMKAAEELLASLPQANSIGFMLIQQAARAGDRFLLIRDTLLNQLFPSPRSDLCSYFHGFDQCSRVCGRDCSRWTLRTCPPRSFSFCRRQMNPCRLIA